MDELQQDRFREWWNNSEHAELGGGSFEESMKEAWLQGWSEAIAHAKDQLDQLKEILEEL